MAGVLPPTKYLLVNLWHIVGEYDSKSEAVLDNFSISISDSGVIEFEGEKQNPSYIIGDDISDGMIRNGFTKEEAIKDWIRHHLKLPPGFKFYRYLVGL